MPDDDVYKILRDLELLAVGVDPNAIPPTMPEGYFTAFRNVGLPLPVEDFSNPWQPDLGNLDFDANQPQRAPVDPATTNATKQTGSTALSPDLALNAAIAQTFHTYLNTFSLTEQKLVMDQAFEVMPGSTKVSDSWWAIVTGATLVPPPATEPDSVKQARAVLVNATGDPTDHYKAYRKLQETYTSTVRMLNRAYTEAFKSDPVTFANWPNDGVTYQDAVDAALQDWEALGYKSEIETALDTLAAQGEDPSIALIARAKNRFLNSLKEFPGAGKIPYVSLVPSSWYDTSQEDGWSTYGSTQIQSSREYHSSGTAYGASGGLQIGLWHAGGNFNKTDAQTSLNVDSHDLTVSFSYCSVDIVRWGVDTALLNLRNWYLQGNYKKHTISDGTMGQKVSDTPFEPTFLPSLATSLILIRDLKLTLANATQAQSAIDNALGGGGSVGWGPFGISGQYSHHQVDSKLSYSLSDKTLSVDGTQLIGYVSQIMPPSPGIDSPPASGSPTMAENEQDMPVVGHASTWTLGPRQPG